MSDQAIRKMLGFDDKPIVLAPEAPKPRLDLSRCRTYAVNNASEAIGMYRAEYHCEPDFCIAAPIGGRTKVTGWTVGMIPLAADVASLTAPSASASETRPSHNVELDDNAT